MIKKVLTIASAIALCGTFFAKADSINYGIALDGGASFGGATKKGKLEGKSFESKAATNINWNPALFFGMDFGDDGAEMGGFELTVGFGGRKLALKAPETNDADKTKKKESKSPYEADLKGVTFGVAGKVMFAHFDGGCVFAKLGVDGYWAAMKDIKKDGADIKDEKLKKEEKDFLNAMNVGAKLVIGVELMDSGIFVGVGGRYFFLEQFSPSADRKKTMQADGGSMSLGSGQIDANLFLGFNIAKLIA
jgi:hypothetical protein